MYSSSLLHSPLLHSPLLLGAVLLYQCVLVQLLGRCPLTGQLHNPRQLLHTAALLALAVFLAIVSAGLIQQLVLLPLQLEAFTSLIAVLCVVLSARAAQFVLQRMDAAPAFAATIHTGIQTGTHNGTQTATQVATQIAVLGIVVSSGQATNSSTGDALSLIASAIISAGIFALIYVLFAALRERLLSSDIPTAFRGAAIHLITAGFFALALMGFAGLV